jgi:hypothetical protein
MGKGFRRLWAHAAVGVCFLAGIALFVQAALYSKEVTRARAWKINMLKLGLETKSAADLDRRSQYVQNADRELQYWEGKATPFWAVGGVLVFVAAVGAGFLWRRRAQGRATAAPNAPLAADSRA